MATPEFDPNDFTPGVASQAPLPAEAANLSEGAKQFIRQYVPADDGKDCIVSFEVKSEFMPFKSKEANTEIYEDVIYIRKSVRGNDKLEVVRPVREEDKREYPFAWQEYQRGEAAAERGTSIAKLPGVDAPTLRHLHAKNIFTIEDLTMVTDSNLQNLGLGARELRKKAFEYIGTHQNVGRVDELQKTVETQSEQLARLMALCEKQNEQIVKLSAPAKKKPGPKPKAKAAEPPQE
jgi:hypothetical protein